MEEVPLLLGPYSSVVERSFGKADTTVRFRVGAPGFMDNKRCECRFCTLYRESVSVKRSGTYYELRKFIDRLMDDLANAEEDLNYHKAIMDGSWPSAKDKAQEILKRVAEREAQPSLALEA